MKISDLLKHLRYYTFYFETEKRDVFMGAFPDQVDAEIYAKEASKGLGPMIVFVKAGQRLNEVSIFDKGKEL